MQLYIDGKLFIDNWTRQRRGDAFFGSGSQEEKRVFTLKANTKHEVFVEYCNVRGPADSDEDETVMDRYGLSLSPQPMTTDWMYLSNPGVRLGGAKVEDPDVSLTKAVQLAKEADVVIAIVGLNADWETEGYDRTTLALPGRTDELVNKVAAANPKTIVVTQSVSLVRVAYMKALIIFRRGRASLYLGSTRWLASCTLGISATPQVMPLLTCSSVNTTRPASCLSLSPRQKKMCRRLVISTLRTGEYCIPRISSL